jgi:hypothetical protein
MNRNMAARFSKTIVQSIEYSLENGTIEDHAICNGDINFYNAYSWSFIIRCWIGETPVYLNKEKELDSKNRQVSIPSETIDKNMNWRQSYKRDSELV